MPRSERIKACPATCGCVRHFENDPTDGLLNSGDCVWYPHYVKNYIMLCGLKGSMFPFHCMVGPDWAIMIMTSISIIVPTVLFLVFISENISRYMTIADAIVATIAIVSHWITAFSDPGIVFTQDTNLYDPGYPHQEFIRVDIERGKTDSTNQTEDDSKQNHDVSLQSSPPERMECAQCVIVRPPSARHCYDCDVCIDQLDHHCPFTGKCIGKKNIQAFYVFVNVLGVHTYFVIGTTAYYIIAKIIVPQF